MLSLKEGWVSPSLPSGDDVGFGDLFLKSWYSDVFYTWAYEELFSGALVYLTSTPGWQYGIGILISDFSF